MMNPSDCEMLIDRLTALAEYYEKPKSEAQIGIYVQALKDLPIAHVLNATSELVKSSQFYPKVSEIRGIVLGTTEDASELAWNGLLRAIRQTGYTGKPDLPAATWEAVREVWGSWVSLCQTLPGDGPEQLGWAKRFKSTYRALEQVAKRPALPLGPEPVKALSE